MRSLVESVSCPDRSDLTFEGTEWANFHYKIWRTFCIYTETFRRTFYRNNFGNKNEKSSSVNLTYIFSIKTPNILDEWNAYHNHAYQKKVI